MKEGTTKKIPRRPSLVNQESQISENKTSQYPLIQTMGLPYTAIFGNYEKIFDQLEVEYNHRNEFQKEESKLTKDKTYVRFRELEDAEDADLQEEESEIFSKKMLLHPKKSIREYVDVI